MSGQITPESPPSGHPGPPLNGFGGTAVPHSHERHGSIQFPQLLAALGPGQPSGLPTLERPSVTRTEAYWRLHSNLGSSGRVYVMCVVLLRSSASGALEFAKTILQDVATGTATNAPLVGVLPNTLVPPLA